MRKWQIESIGSIGGTSPRKLVYAGRDACYRPGLLRGEAKKEASFVLWLRRLVGRIINYL